MNNLVSQSTDHEVLYSESKKRELPPPESRHSSRYHTPVPELEPQSVVTPFLSKHIFELKQPSVDNFHKYCYRHNPDVACNKMTDAAKIRQIQQDLDRCALPDREAILHVWLIFSAAPTEQRTLILQGILLQCCFPQLSEVLQEVSGLIKLDFILILPYEVSTKILCMLDCKSLCNAAQVLRTWKQLADDDTVWHHMCAQHIDRKCPQCGWGLPLMAMKRAREARPAESSPQSHSERRSQSDPAPKRRQVEPAGAAQLQLGPLAVLAPAVRKRPWKTVYLERYTVERNWRNNIFKLKTFKGHVGGVTCLQFNHRYLMTGLYDKTIKVWDVNSGELLNTLEGHTAGLRALVFDDQKLITAGLDHSVKVWNYHTGVCIATYRGHLDGVILVDFVDKVIVSGSADHTVKVWHVDLRTCYTLRGHTDWVNQVRVHAALNTVFSALDDTTVRMWDLELNQCLRVFGGAANKGHIGQVQQVIPLVYKDVFEVDEVEAGDRPCVRTLRGELVVLDAEVAGSVHGGDAEADPNLVPLLRDKKYPTHILTLLLDNTIKLWDVASGKCIRTQFGHFEGVWLIAADSFRIVSGAHDRLVKVWDLQTGKCMHTMAEKESVLLVGLSDLLFAAGLDNGDVYMYSYDR